MFGKGEGYQEVKKCIVAINLRRAESDNDKSSFSPWKTAVYWDIY